MYKLRKMACYLQFRQQAICDLSGEFFIQIEYHQ